jgi:uncharacterized membrane protein YqgA involved in biofilm formation
MFATMLPIIDLIKALLNTILGIAMMIVAIPVFIITFIVYLFYRQFDFQRKNKKR